MHEQVPLHPFELLLNIFTLMVRGWAWLRSKLQPQKIYVPLFYFYLYFPRVLARLCLT